MAIEVATSCEFPASAMQRSSKREARRVSLQLPILICNSYAQVRPSVREGVDMEASLHTMPSPSSNMDSKADVCCSSR